MPFSKVLAYSSACGHKKDFANLLKVFTIPAMSIPESFPVIRRKVAANHHNLNPQMEPLLPPSLNFLFTQIELGGGNFT
jgi:hypothetical protein